MLETMYRLRDRRSGRPRRRSAWRAASSSSSVARDGEPPQPMRIANPETIVAFRDSDARGSEGPPVLARALMPMSNAPMRSGCAISTTKTRFCEIEAKGLLAATRLYSTRFDHLDGVLFVGHISDPQ